MFGICECRTEENPRVPEEGMGENVGGDGEVPEASREEQPSVDAGVAEAPKLVDAIVSEEPLRARE